VILVDFDGRARRENPPLLYWDRARGAFLGPRDVNGDRDRKNPDEKAWRDHDRVKNLEESKRIFYVALTRAQERLVLVCPDLPEETAGEGWRAWIDAVPGAGDAEVDARGMANKQPLKTSERAHREPLARVSEPVGLRRSRHSVTEWSRFRRCPRLYEWSYLRPPAESARKKEFLSLSDENTRLTALELGSRVHLCLERADWDGLRALEREAGEERFSAEKVIEWARSSQWMQPGCGQQVWSELAFELPVEGEILVGAIDRLILQQEERGERFVILDYKVTRQAKTREELLDAYQDQMDFYAWALGRLEPRARGATRVLLVNISSDGVSECDVPLSDWVSDESKAAQFLGAHVSTIKKILQGAAGDPHRGGHCQTCDFVKQCV
jgi:ATP-dependent exoDNAse (exonuclease V) beta subunit